MNRKLVIPLLFTWFLILVAASLHSQPPTGPFIISPQVHADKRITFRYVAPGTKDVKLSGQFEKGLLPMTKEGEGIWTITVGPVKPDIYPYSFIVDGITVMDPANVGFFPNERFKASLVDVPGESSLVHSVTGVPHGTVTYAYYPSIESSTGSMVIYAPYGNVRPKPMASFSKDVVSDLIPFIEANYPVFKDSNKRAIAGFSVGGGQTLNIGLTNTSTFAYVCSYAPYTATDEFRSIFANWTPDAASLNRQLKLFTISVGTEDFLYESVNQNIAMFGEKGLKLKSTFVPGGHTWMNCKLFLATTLQEIFR